MKTLVLFAEENKDDLNFLEKTKRAKLIVKDSEERPEYIEIDNKKGDCKVRMNFADNRNWKGSMEDLNKNLRLAELSKKLIKAVQNGDDFDGFVESMIMIEGGLK